MELNYQNFRETFERLRKQIFVLEDEDKVHTATHLEGELDTVIHHGLENVGIFHLKRPILLNKKGNIITQDLTTLYYYHNRLTGYDLERFI